MSTPLSKNPDHLDTLCSRLDLGVPQRSLARVRGGFHHRVWKLETERGKYAVKQIAADSHPADPDTRQHYNTSEAIAEAFSHHGIPAIHALCHDSDYLQVLGREGYLVHPWTSAVAIPITEVSEHHALRVARIMAGMHRIDLDFPATRQQEFTPPLQDNIRLLVEMSQALHVKLHKTLRLGLPTFLDIASAQAPAIRTLQNHLVISHGDLDQKNVLWDRENQPLLIDWESARKCNPNHEVLLEALNWSGIGSQFDHDLVTRFIAAYQDAGGALERGSMSAAYHCLLGDWLNWLMYNVGRCLHLEHAEERRTGEAQIEYTLGTLQRIMDYVPDLLDVSNPPATGNAGEVRASV